MVKVSLVITPRASFALKAELLVAELQPMLEAGAWTCILGPQCAFQFQAIDQAQIVKHQVVLDSVFELDGPAEVGVLAGFQYSADERSFDLVTCCNDALTNNWFLIQVDVVYGIVTVVVDNEHTRCGLRDVVQAELPHLTFLNRWRDVVLGPWYPAFPAVLVDLEDIGV